MACERWWVPCCYVNVFVVAIGFSIVAADRGSYYNYDTRSLGSSGNVAEAPDYLFLDDETSVRHRRSPLEPLISENVSTTEIAHPSISSIPKLNSSSVNVAYSTDNSSRNATSQPASANAAQSKPEVVVSQPLNPATGKVDAIRPTVWANATMRPPTVTQRPVNKTENIVTNATVVNATVPSEDPVTAININRFGDVTNSTLSQNNITKTEEDTHQYYNSTIFVNEAEGKKLWVDMKNHPNVFVNDLLSKSHRRAATVKLSFDFPFYGHIVRNVTIATGGFLYTGEYVHSWLAATQYIAPLMANFDTTLSNDSYVKYADNGTAFTVEWEKVVLQEKPTVGAFTFQATLHKNGDIVFVYAAVPLVVEKIQDNFHPVKVGLSDAYIIDRTVVFVRRKTIYEYHRVNFMRQDIRNGTVIQIRALPTCLGMHNCDDCLSGSTGFECKWCPSLKKCSTGTDRQRQEWITGGCESSSIKEGETCPAKIVNSTSYNEHDHDVHGAEGTASRDDLLSAGALPSQHQAKALRPSEDAPAKMKMGVASIFGILIVVSLVIALVGWAVYAYRNPHSTSGQVLIRYRPSQWSWRRGEARYTAATIHM